MNAFDRLGKLFFYHKEMTALPCQPDTFMRGFHSAIDILDKKIGVDTTGGRRHNPVCGPPHGQPKNYVGTRLRLHEEYIRKDTPPFYDEWQANENYMWGIHNPWY